MSYNNPETPTKIPPDIFTDTMQLTVPTIFQNKVVKAAASQPNQLKEDEFLQKKQDKYTSTTNLAAILSLLDVQLCLEEDSEILAILTS